MVTIIPESWEETFEALRSVTTIYKFKKNKNCLLKVLYFWHLHLKYTCTLVFRPGRLN